MCNNFFRGFCQRCSKQLIECPMCRATIEEVASDNIWHQSYHINVFFHYFSYNMQLSCLEKIITDNLRYILYTVITCHIIFCLQCNALINNKDYKLIVGERIPRWCMTRKIWTSFCFKNQRTLSANTNVLLKQNILFKTLFHTSPYFFYYIDI